MRSGSPRTTSFNVSCRIPLPLPVFTGPLPWGRGWTGRDQGHLRILLAWRGEGQSVALLEAQTGSSPGENLGAFMECWLCTGAFLGPSRGVPSLILLAIVTDPLAGLSRVSPAGRCAVGTGKSGSSSGRARTDSWSSRRGPGGGVPATCALRLWSWWHLHEGPCRPHGGPLGPCCPAWLPTSTAPGFCITAQAQPGGASDSPRAPAGGAVVPRPGSRARFPASLEASSL